MRKTIRKFSNNELWCYFALFLFCSFAFAAAFQIPNRAEWKGWYCTDNMLALWMILCIFISGICLGVLALRASIASDVDKALKQFKATLNLVVTEHIIIGTEYEHVKGKYKLVTITNKTRNSVQFKDGHGYISWVGFDEFSKLFTLKTK